jgi:hydroxyacylglutathione hydrolase
MFFQKVKTPGIAHVAYLFGDKGEAALVDPRRDIQEYLKLARENDLTIKLVLETHRQEDFVIGSTEVARATGAKIVTLDHSLFGHSDIRLRDGEEFHLGGLTVRALHTPGHTPESTCYAVYVKEAPGRAWGVFTGDTLFVGETGRTDLTNRKKTTENAGVLFDAIQEKLLPLGDQTIIWPAHGAGSVCGGNIAERDDSTLGLERLSNPAFTMTREKFMAAKLHERIPRPPYFTLMEEVNLRGGLPPVDVGSVALLPPRKFAEESKLGIILDGRSPEAFAGGHIPGSYSMWLDGMGVFGGWIAKKATRVFLVLGAIDELEQAVLSLARLGVDHVEGVLAGGFAAWRDAGQPIAMSGTISPKQLMAARDEHLVLDVRDDVEFEDEGHIPDGTHLYVGYLDEHLGRLKSELASRPHVAVVCSVGHRASLATSILLRHGVRSARNLLGGMTAWKKLELPTRKGKDHSVTTPDIEGERK